MENVLELSSPDDISKVFTDKIHCTLTMEQLVDVSMKVIDTEGFNRAVVMILPFDLTISVFNAFLIKYQGKFDGIEFEYRDSPDKHNEHEVYIARNGIAWNRFYNTEQDCNYILSVSPALNENADGYVTTDNACVLLHTNISKELKDKYFNNPQIDNHIIMFDLKE